MQKIAHEILEHQSIANELLANLQSYIYTARIILQEAIQKNKKIYLFGNDENVFQANHMAYLLNEYCEKNIAISLCNDIAFITKISQEHGADYIFEKQLLRCVLNEDVFIGFSNSGASKSILRALSFGQHRGCKTIGFSSGDGGAIRELSDVSIIIPSSDKFRIQEMYGIVKNILIRA